MSESIQFIVFFLLETNPPETLCFPVLSQLVTLQACCRDAVLRFSFSIIWEFLTLLLDPLLCFFFFLIYSLIWGAHSPIISWQQMLGRYIFWDLASLKILLVYTYSQSHWIYNSRLSTTFFFFFWCEACILFIPWATWDRSSWSQTGILLHCLRLQWCPTGYRIRSKHLGLAVKDTHSFKSIHSTASSQQSG